MSNKNHTPNPYAEAVDPDTVVIHIKGCDFLLSAHEASMYGVHISNAARQCDMMLDKGFVPERLSYDVLPTNHDTITKEWIKEIKTTRDSEGKRFWIAALYLAAGKTPLAINYCMKFIKDSQNKDTGYDDPAFLLSYLIASFETSDDFSPGSLNESILFELYIANPYIIDIAIDNDINPLDGRVHFSNRTSYGWARNIPLWLYKLISPKLKDVIKQIQKRVSFYSFCSIHTELNKKCITRNNGELDELLIFESRYSTL
jgi:hypothetical protein